MSDSEEAPNVRVYESRVEYKRKDGSIGYKITRSSYKPTGKPRGRPGTYLGSVKYKLNDLSDKELKKVDKYIEKIKLKDADRK